MNHHYNVFTYERIKIIRVKSNAEVPTNIKSKQHFYTDIKVDSIIKTLIPSLLRERSPARQ